MSYELSAIISIGLENKIIEEFNLKKDHFFDGVSISISTFSGGVSFTFEDPSYFHLIKILRSPTKYFLKFAEFKCRDLPKLYNKIIKLPWEKVLYSKDIEVTASAKKSRIIHSKKIEETTIDALQKWLIANPRKKLPLSEFTKKQKIHIHIENDNAFVRINCSGEPNYKRNLRKTQGIAPLRENYAYILVSELTNNLLDLKENTTLLDPMCGSATFLSEANNFFQPITDRDFSYEYFYFLKSLQKLNIPNIETKKLRLAGVEKNKHLENFHQENFSSKKNIKFFYGDFFKTKMSEFYPNNTYIICNLPYGKRIKVEKDIIDFYKRFIKKINSDFPKSSAGILLPSNFARKLKLSTLISFKNGGLNVSFCQINSGLNTNSTRMGNQN